MEAASIKQLDKLKASGKHYTRYAQFPTAVGVDGVGRLANGERVYAMGVSGMLAQYAVAKTDSLVPVPEDLSAELAALLPNALLGSDAALLLRGDMQEGQTLYQWRYWCVWAHGGVGRIIVSGRNAESLQTLRQFGADQCISLLASPAEQLEQLLAIQQESPMDLILDYLWGEPVQTLLNALAQRCPQPVKIVTIGQMAGAQLELASSVLRSQPISMLGSGLGSISAAELRNYNQTQLPKMLQLAAQGQLQASYEVYPLEQISQAWQAHAQPGSRIVVSIK